MLRELEEFYEKYCESIREEADQLRTEEMPAISEELFAIYEHTGNRLTYENVYFMRRKFLAVFGLKAILDREPGDIRKLEEILKDICREECWALPAHVNRKTDKNWRIYVDLFAAETAQALAEITFLLKGVLSSETTEIVRHEVRRRVLLPFSTSKAPYGVGWEYAVNNWCAVCGGSVGSAAIYMMQDREEELETLLERISYSLETYYLKSFTEDGVCPEGLGYFTYGMTYFIGFADQLYTFTAGKRNLFRNEKLAKIAAFQAKCYFQSGRTVSFSDGSTEETFRPGLTCYLAMKYPGAEIPAMERAAGLNNDGCYRWMGLYRNLTWTKDYIEAIRQGKIADTDTAKKTFIETSAAQTVFPQAQWSICQSAGGAGMAAKGGHNDEPHNHNDVGSFLYLIGKDFLLADLGSGEYTRDYFSEKRYENLCCRSLGHNVPVIDGGEQVAGEEYGCDRFEADGLGRTVISFAGAYANPELKALVRTLNWNAADGTLWVEDSFEITERLQSVRENLITQWKPEIEGNTIKIKGDGKGCVIVVEDTDVTIECIRRSYSDHSGIYRDVWLLQWEVPVAGTAGRAASQFSVTAL